MRYKEALKLENDTPRQQEAVLSEGLRELEVSVSATKNG